MRKFISLFMLLAVLFLVSCENVEYHIESSQLTSEESLNIYEELESQLPGMGGEDIEEREFVIFTDRVTTYSYDETAPESINLAILERASFL